MSYENTLEKVIIRLDGEEKEKDKRIAELMIENKQLQECFDECYEELQLTRDAGDKRIAELDKERFTFKKIISNPAMAEQEKYVHIRDMLKEQGE